MNIIITGGAGFVGSHIADRALSDGHQVLIIDDLSTGNRDNVPSGAEFKTIDIVDADAFSEAAKAFGPDVICHHAAQASVAVSVREPVRDAEVNLIGSINALEIARDHGARVVFASTGGALYGEVLDPERADESRPPQPMSPYACSKAAFENYLNAYHKTHGLSCVTLRYGNVFGPRQDPHGEAGVVAIFLQRLLKGESIQVNARQRPGDDGCVRDYVFVDDVVKANMLAFGGALDGQMLNVGTGIGTSTRTLAQILVKLVGAEAELRDGDHRPGDLERSVLDPTKLVELMGQPTTLEDGLSKTAAWFAKRHSESMR